ncbi:l-3-72Dp, partial [Drosophila busckii]
MLKVNYTLLIALTLACGAAVSNAAGSEANGTVAPIIGVLAQEIYEDSLIARHFNSTSYIAASYVKFVEGAGGRVVPIWIGQERSYYENLLRQINGVLLPGGGTWFNNSKGYGEAGEHIIHIAKEINTNASYFPVWGTCLGMELLVLVMNNNVETRFDCKSQGQTIPLDFKPTYNESRMFAGASAELITLMSKQNVTYNYHRNCYTQQSFENSSWRIMSINNDLQGVEFVSTIEHLQYPFYGVQFHPEKNLYEFVSKLIPHTAGAVHSAQYFADFFISEARRNKHTFDNAAEQSAAMIYNYKPEYTAKIGSGYIQQYLFDTDSEEEVEETPEEPEPVEPEPDPDNDHPYPNYPYYMHHGDYAAATQPLLTCILMSLAFVVCA